MLKRACAAMLLGALLLPLQASAATRSTTTVHSYTQPGGLTRGYRLYVPAGLKPNRPVMVVLHGCNQTAAEAEIATGFDALADKERFAVVYPMQVVAAGSTAPATDGNGIGCWNWFLPEHQARGAGEPGVLAGLTQQVVNDLRSDRTRVYVEGVSAGADMSVILAANYPDVYAAAGALAGCSFSSCGDTSGELTYKAMGSRARVVPLFVENGTADTINPATLSTGLVQSWLGADDLADDGSMNGSMSRVPATTQNTVPTGTPNPGGGDPCVHNNSATCPGGVLGLSDYPVTVQTWSSTGKDVLELWLVHGMQHAQPHGPSGQPYTDPLGPDISKASYAFFARHHLP